MAIYMVALFGGTPIGAPLLGWLAEVAGARWSLIGGGLATLVLTLLAVACLRPRSRAAANLEAAADREPAPENPIDGRVQA